MKVTGGHRPSANNFATPVHLPQRELSKRSIAASRGRLTPSVHRGLGFGIKTSG